MRTDRTRSSELIRADAWKSQKYRDTMFVKLDNGPPYYKSNSFSGSEANHMFLNDGKNYHDVTLISDADHKGDGRGFARIDFNGDGWLDIALVSTNKPRFQLLQNQMGAVSENRRYRIKLQGSQQTASAETNRSNRDGIGSRVVATYQSGRSMIQHRQSGEGNVAQNSDLIWIGFSSDDPVTQVEVLWPSGQREVLKDLSIDKINFVAEPEPE